MHFNLFKIRYGYHAALRHSHFQRKRFANRVAQRGWHDWEASSDRLPISVLAMAGASCLPEMVRCLATFRRYAGSPARFRIVSDGTLAKAEMALLRKGGAEVVPFTKVLAPGLPEVITSQWNRHWMIRKQAVLMSMALDGPELFVDADFEFFPGAERLGQDLLALGDQPAYMADVQPALDERMLRLDNPRHPSVNSGFLYLPSPVDWSEAVDRFSALPANAELKNTDQTMAHLAMHARGGVALDPDRYVLAIDDQFEWRDRYAQRCDVVCRHYVGTIRHKMWNRWRLLS